MTAPVPTTGEVQTMPALTAARFFLAMGVVLFHLQLMWSWPTLEHTSLIERARLGVDAFFILSGFVLAHVYDRQFDTRSFSYQRFIVARLARIYPAHLAVLAVMGLVAIAAWILGERLDPERYSALGFLETALMVHAWRPHSAAVEWNGPSWSLSAEWAAYLAFPVIMLVLRRRPALLLFFAALSYLVIDAGYRRWFHQPLLHAEFNLGVLRIIPSFLAGIALRRLTVDFDWPPTRARLATFGMTVLLLWCMHTGAAEPVVVATAGAWIVSLAASPGTIGIVGGRSAVFLGEASYAIYLVHLPAIVVWKNARAILAGGDSSYVLPGWEVFMLVSLILIAGVALHVVIERPARRWIRNTWTTPRRLAEHG